MAFLRISNKFGITWITITIVIFFLMLLSSCDESTMNTGMDPDSGAMGLDEIISVSEELDCSLGTYNDEQWVQCNISTSFYPLNWNEYEAAVNEYLKSEGFVITDDSVIYIEAKGGKGANGGGSITNSGGTGGEAGYARTATTIGNLKDNIFEETIVQGQIQYQLYVLVAAKGIKFISGGDGGSSTIIIGKKLLEIASDTSQPEDQRVLVIAGGGGGGGRGGFARNGDNGGKGGDAVAITNRPDSVRGRNGKGPNSDSGNGGNREKNGERTGLGGKGGGHIGNNGIGGKGGGDNATNPWLGIDPIAKDFGNGGDGTDVGGSGGGGFGGGGGGRETTVSAGAGGGAAGSWAREITFDAGNFGLEGPFVGKSNMPSNGNNGSVVFTIEVFSISE